MKTVSLKIDDAIFGETEEILTHLQKSRNRYINDALDHYNKKQRKLLLEEQLKKESALVQENSMAVLREFEDLDHDH